jgi:hypothetical protein
MSYWSVVEDYSLTPLSKKLGIKEESTVLLHAPKGFDLDVSPGVVLRRQARGRAEVILAFYVESLKLEQEIEKLGQMIVASEGLWIAWPKKASGVATTLTDHVVRDIALPLGLVDNKVCALEATWTALQLTWRRSVRAGTS